MKKGENYSEIEEQEIIKRYFQCYRNLTDSDILQKTFRAGESVENIIVTDYERGLDIVLKLLKECNDDDNALAYVAAGPLENLLIRYGNKVIDRIRKEADSDCRIQLALSGVWLCRNDEVYHEWVQLMKRYGFIGSNPRKAL